jgi:uncharacterized protein (TIGR02145 family)
MKKTFSILFIIFFLTLTGTVNETLQLQSNPQNTPGLKSKSQNFNNNQSSRHTSFFYLRRVLILGDSHMLGKFSEHLHNNLHQTDNFDIMSIAIGGAGTRNYTKQMKNNCCSYVIRRSQNTNKQYIAPEIHRIESGRGKTGEIVGKSFDGHLENVLSYFNPNIVIIALGNNVLNEHETLVNLIKSNNEKTQIIWLGPILKVNTSRQLGGINEVIENYDIELIRSDDIVGYPHVRSIHFTGKTLEVWAETVVQRMLPHIEHNQTLTFQNKHSHSFHDYLPELMSYSEKLNQYHEQSTITNVISSIADNEMHFSNRLISEKYGKQNVSEKAPEFVIDIDGNMYKTIVIGNQCWMVDNLRTTSFNNGKPIENMNYHTAAFSRKKPIYTTSPPIPKSNVVQTGMLYSWYVVDNKYNVCPKGWRVPNTSDWINLVNHSENQKIFFNTNTPINYHEQFIHVQNSLYAWWTSDQIDDNTSSAWAYTIDNATNEFSFINKQNNMALPIRCIME